MQEETMTNAKTDEDLDVAARGDDARAERETGEAPREAEDPSLDEAMFEEAPVIDEIETLRAERDDMRDRFMRALADAENMRKRADRDRREAEQYGGSKLARDMLPVHDNLKRALKAAEDENGDGHGAVIEGVELTMRELLNVFRRHGIEVISPERGDRFDPQRHQAMFEAPVPDTKAGDIIEVMNDGFMLHDRLLRPAQVGVSSSPAK
jgi:molecular chaperone GrpE